MINAEVDAVLATSARTAEVLAARGIDRDVLEVAYIGTAVAEKVDRWSRHVELHQPGVVRVAYLGYMRRDKGFHHMVDALGAAPPSDADKIELVVAATRGDDHVMHRLSEVAEHIGGVWHYDGYTHDELDAILTGVDIGIVPVQWEDNLPQVAIEMVAHGLPILTTDRGGAQELGGNHPGWTFSATDPTALVNRLVAVADGITSLKSYWESAQPLVTMDDHLEQLLDIYAGR